MELNERFHYKRLFALMIIDKKKNEFCVHLALNEL